MMIEKSNITMPPEGMKECKEKNGEEKQYVLPQMSLKKENIFRRRVERNCWKTNNEKDKLVVGLWEHPNIMR